MAVILGVKVHHEGQVVPMLKLLYKHPATNFPTANNSSSSTKMRRLTSRLNFFRRFRFGQSSGNNLPPIEPALRCVGVDSLEPAIPEEAHNLPPNQPSSMCVEVDSSEPAIPEAQNPEHWVSATPDAQDTQRLASTDQHTLPFAASSGNVDFIDLLDETGSDEKKPGLDFNAANIIGGTPLHHAAANGHVEEVKLLLSKGASVSVEDLSKRTALHYAVLGGNIGVVEALLEKKANPTAVDIHGRSPLHMAVATTNSVIVRKLLETGGDALLMITDRDGKTARDMVADKVGKMIAEALCEC